MQTPERPIAAQARGGFMKRFLIGLLFLAAFGMALAQPVDYQLSCDIDGEPTVIGVVSVVEDNYHVAVLAGVICDPVVVTPVDAPFTVELELDAEGDLVVTLYFDDPAYVFELTLVEVPQEALAGMQRAQELRAMAMERREFGQAQADERGAAMRPDVPEGDEFEVEIDDGPPAVLPLPDPAREAPRP